MSHKELPARPDLEQYRKQAKDLFKDLRANVPDARLRVQQSHPRFTTAPPPDDRFTLADAQLVLAREHGFPSWAKFRAHIVTLNLEQSVEQIKDPVAAFLIAASVPRGTWHASATLDEAEMIRARYPQVYRADIYTAAVLGDEDQVRSHLGRDSGLATALGGPYGWSPLTWLCFSRYLRLDASRSDGFTAAARLLLQGGADPNAGWHEEPDYHGGKPVWESNIYGAAGLARHPGVTRLLLDHGADPNDGETPYHAPETWDNTVMQILLESGKLDTRSKVWLLVRKADWHDYDGMKMALDYGADPNWIPHWGHSPLQHAVLRDNSLDMIALLIDHGADPLAANPHTGRSAAAMAARHGRRDVINLLAERGLDPKFSDLNRLIAACALADNSAIDSLLKETPDLRAQLLTEGGQLLGDFAGFGNAAGVGCLLDLGVAIDTPYPGDGYFDRAKNATALHIAAWHSRPDVVKLLLRRGASVNVLDGKNRTPLQLAVKACIDSYWTDRRTPEPVAALLNAGASLEGIEVPCGYDEVDALLIQRAGTRPADTP